MKYLIILAILAGSYYQFYFPKLNEETVQEFFTEIELASMNKDYESISKQHTDSVLISVLDSNLEIVTQKEVTKKNFIKLIKMLNKPKYNSVDKGEIERIDFLGDKAVITSLNTSWITADGQRIKQISRQVMTIIIQDASLKVSEIGLYLIKSGY